MPGVLEACAANWLSQSCLELLPLYSSATVLAFCSRVLSNRVPGRAENGLRDPWTLALCSLSKVLPLAGLLEWNDGEA